MTAAKNARGVRERARAWFTALACFGLVFVCPPWSARGDPDPWSIARYACDQGDAEACNSLGVALEGLREFAESARYLERACRLGLPIACSNLAELFVDGRGVQMDKVKGLKLFSEACQAGEGQGCSGICATFFEVMQNFTASQRKRCAAMLEVSCRVGNAWMCNRKKLVPAALTDGQEKLLHDACAAGQVNACLVLGTAYAMVERFGEAVRATRSACKLDPHGCSNLGELYFSGSGVPRNLGEARKHFQSACEGGVTSGCAGVCLVDQVGGRDSKDDAAQGDCPGGIVAACQQGNLWMCEQLVALSQRERPPPTPSAPRAPARIEASQCSAQDRVKAQQLFQQSVQAGLVNDLGTTLAALFRELKKLPPACLQQLAQDAKAQKQQGDVLRQVRELQQLDRLGREMIELREGEMMGKAAELGIYPK